MAFYKGTDDRGNSCYVFECDRCGFKQYRRRHMYGDINRHFRDAEEILCPRNVCKELYGRKIAAGMVRRTWYEYSQWETVEPPEPLTEEQLQGVIRARKILHAALRQKVDSGEWTEEEFTEAWIHAMSKK